MRFWSRNRTDYFTQGIRDGRKAAFSSLPTVEADTTRVRERALFAVAALPGQVAPADDMELSEWWGARL